MEISIYGCPHEHPRELQRQIKQKQRGWRGAWRVDGFVIGPSIGRSYRVGERTGDPRNPSVNWRIRGRRKLIGSRSDTSCYQREVNLREVEAERRLAQSSR